MAKPVAEDFDRAFEAVLAEAAQRLDRCDAHGLNAGLEAARRHGPDPAVLELNRRQPEFNLGLGAYVNRVVTPDRGTVAREHALKHHDVLERIEARFGVPGAILVAVWALESNFGRSTGRFDVVRALATLAACDVRRTAYWRDELVAALTIAAERAAEGHVPLTGSWAGALGHVQFMPSVYLSDAVRFAEIDDHAASGSRADIWNNPADALASAAKYLSRHGWSQAPWWGFEVTAAAEFDWTREELFDARAPRSYWEAGGLSPMHTTDAPAMLRDLRAKHLLRFLAPEGVSGPKFLVTSGFDAVLAYNPSTAYAIAIGLIADRAAGRSGDVPSFLEDNALLSRDALMALQTALVARGWDTGGVDGMLGSATRRAVRARQRDVGFVPDGFPTRATIDGLLGSEP